MDCTECGGACCESFALQLPDLAAALPSTDELEWAAAHGEVASTPGYLRLECKCGHLTGEGRCGIYEKRFEVCRDFQPGGTDCLATIRQRRSPAERLRILG